MLILVGLKVPINLEAQRTLGCKLASLQCQTARLERKRHSPSSNTVGGGCQHIWVVGEPLGDYLPPAEVAAAAAAAATS